MTEHVSEVKTAAFLHVATIGRYRETSDEMLTAVVRRADATGMTDVHIVVVGTGEFNPCERDERIVVKRASPDVRSFELPTLRMMWQYARKHPDRHLLYLNCLGGRYTGTAWQIRAEWRRLLNLLLLERSSQCLRALSDHDVCGIEWSLEPLPHMTSNNWWARGDYVAMLRDPQDYAEQGSALDLSQYGADWSDREFKLRHMAEFWIGSGDRVSPVSLFPLTALGFPRGKFGSVSWWDLPRVPWTRIAAARIDGGSSARIPALARLWALKYQARNRLRWIRRKPAG